MDSGMVWVTRERSDRGRDGETRMQQEGEIKHHFFPPSAQESLESTPQYKMVSLATLQSSLSTTGLWCNTSLYTCWNSVRATESWYATAIGCQNKMLTNTDFQAVLNLLLQPPKSKTKESVQFICLMSVCRAPSTNMVQPFYGLHNLLKATKAINF